MPGIVGSAQESVQDVFVDRKDLQYGAADERRLGTTISVRREEIARRGGRSRHEKDD